jgi:hypothetical protein
LLVDDEPDITMSFKATLQNSGFHSPYLPGSSYRIVQVQTRLL